MPYPDRQNCWPYDEAEQPSLSFGVVRVAAIGVAAVVLVLIWIF
jgi:hypothetical protein